MSNGDNKCAACGQWAGRGHRCPTPQIAFQPIPPASESPDRVDFVSEAVASTGVRLRADVNDRTARAQAALAVAELSRESTIMSIEADGTKRWRNGDGQLHRNNGPSVVMTNGDTYWHRNGKLHREDGPAVEHANGYKEWYMNGKLHRVDGPAIEHEDGSKAWWVNGERHREDGPAVETADGSKEWWVNDREHRVDGPAVEWANGDKEYWVNGLLHRTDGPAIEDSAGYTAWYVNGKQVAPF